MIDDDLLVFIVDDDPAARLICARALEGPGRRIREFADGAAALAAIGERPDIVVLDVEMPGIDGVEVCRSMRAEGLVDAEIVFASCHDDLETRLAAHDAGGSDYLVKPYTDEELLRKIETARRAILARREVAEHTRSVRATPSSAAAATDATAVVGEFQRAAAACRTTEELGRLLCDTLAHCGLHGLVELRGARADLCYSSRGRLTALEASILDHVRGMESVFRFHDRIAIRHPHATLLIPNLPPADHERAACAQGHLALLVGIAEARLSALSCEERRKTQAQHVGEAADQLAGLLDDIHRHGCRDSATTQLKEAIDRLMNIVRD